MLKSRQGQVLLAKPAQRRETSRKTDSPAESGGDFDAALFDALCSHRKVLAAEQRVPPYVIFSDATLRDMARRIPTSLVEFRQIKGVGEAKLKTLCPRFLDVILAYINGHSTDKNHEESTARSIQENIISKGRLSASRSAIGFGKEEALRRFAEGASFDEVFQQSGKAASTVVAYLCEYLQVHAITTPEPWVATDVYHAVRRLVIEVGNTRLKPLYEALDKQVSYKEIRICLALIQNTTWDDGLSG
jgi:ATP-dependent DNA helicase RecQ